MFLQVSSLAACIQLLNHIELYQKVQGNPVLEVLIQHDAPHHLLFDGFPVCTVCSSYSP